MGFGIFENAESVTVVVEQVAKLFLGFGLQRRLQKV